MVANDAGLFELAGGLAVRVHQELPEADDRSRLTRAFRLCLCRAPAENELRFLLDYLVEQRGQFASNPDAAAKVAVGAAMPESMDTTDGAAWVAVARVLLNLDEFIARE